MNLSPFRDRALKVLLTIVGLALIAGLYPLVSSLWNHGDVSPGDQMILGIYFPIGIFLLLAVRDLRANRSLIVCFGWSTIAHMAVMAVQALQGGSRSIREDLPPDIVIALIGLALILLAPAKKAPASSSAAGA